MIDGNSVLLEFNQGNLNFSGPLGTPTLPTGPGSLYQIIAGDLNGDGRNDLVVLGSPSIAIVMLNRGGGVFPLSAQTVLQTGQPATYLTVVDLNKDGLLDLLLFTVDGTSVLQFLNQGHGQYSPQPKVITLSNPIVSEVNGIFHPLIPAAVGDLDGDGLPDLAAVRADSKAIVLYRNSGDGFQGQSPSTLLDGNQLTSVQLADLNRDGAPDLMVLGDHGMTMLANQGGGKFQGQSVSLPTPIYAATVDLNGDGWLDLLFFNMGQFPLYPARGPRQFAQTPILIPDSRLFVDVTGDGKVDLVNIIGYSVDVFPNISQ